MATDDDLPGALSQIRRALKPDGILSVTLWNKEEPPKSVLKLYATMVAAARDVDGGKDIANEVRKRVAGTTSKLPLAVRRRALNPTLPAFRLSARALPRPSARASAKLANSTVNHNHTAICSATPVDTTGSGNTHKIVVKTAVSSTTSITGERLS